jgi:hypothetical protein
MTVCYEIIDYGKFICKVYYFIQVLIDVMWSSSLKGYLCVKLKGKSAGYRICMDWILRNKLSEENVNSEGDAVYV